MIIRPHFETYSIPARVCFAIALVGGALLVALVVTNIYFIK